MEQNPLTGDIKRLENQPTAFRRRVGEWRIFFDVDPDQRLVEVDRHRPAHHHHLPGALSLLFLWPFYYSPLLSLRPKPARLP